MMGWETRSRGGRYYTRSRRENGRIIREYVGTGPLAESIAARDAHIRAERTEARERERREREHLEAADGLIADFCQEVEGLARNMLAAAGYHQHARGEWRKQRGPANRER